ncbi:hypothetical protein GCM10027563_18040 [Parasphingorhabdus pacifica]
MIEVVIKVIKAVMAAARMAPRRVIIAARMVASVLSWPVGDEGDRPVRPAVRRNLTRTRLTRKITGWVRNLLVGGLVGARTRRLPVSP